LLTTGLGKKILPGAGTAKPERYHIPPGPATRRLLDQARQALGAADPAGALQALSDMKVPALEPEIDLLGGRLSELQRVRRLAVDAPAEESRAFNRLSRDIRDLIGALEKEAEAGAVNHRSIRDYLRKRYANRLDQKLAQRQPVNLRRIPSTEGTSPGKAATFLPYNSVEIGGALARNFEDARGRLLLIGIPGAGKTTLMLQLVLELLESEPDDLPVLLNLATWSRDYLSLDAWLKKILPAELGVSEPFAEEIIRQNRLVLLLDGFDEIREADRESCLEALGRYGEHAQRRFVLSSRIDEYRKVAKDAPVYWQIEVGPLSLAQMESELERLWNSGERPEPEARAFLMALRDHELLFRAVQTPFYFNTLQILFAGGRTLGDLHFQASTVDDLQAEIREYFVEYELKSAVKQHYEPERAAHWLSFLASRMSQRNMVTFELRDLQYDWWKWRWWELVVAFLAVGFIIGVLLGIVAGIGFGVMAAAYEGLDPKWVFGLVGKLQGGVIAGGVAGLIAGMLGGLLAGVVFAMVGLLGLSIGGERGRRLFLVFYKIETTDNVKWSFQQFNQRLKTQLDEILVTSFFFSLITGVVGGMAGKMIWGIGYGIVAGLLIGFAFVLNHSKDIIQISTPYQRFTSSLKSLNFCIVLHWILDVQLRRKALLPPDLVAFLNEMSLRHLLEFDGDPASGTAGGSWRFRHRILQENFKEKWKGEA